MLSITRQIEIIWAGHIVNALAALSGSSRGIYLSRRSCSGQRAASGSGGNFPMPLAAQLNAYEVCRRRPAQRRLMC